MTDEEAREYFLDSEASAQIDASKENPLEY